MTVMRLHKQILLNPPNLTGFIRPCCELHWQKMFCIQYVTPIESIDNIIGECEGKISKRGRNDPTTVRPVVTFKFGNECSFLKHDIVDTPVSKGHWNDEKTKDRPTRIFNRLQKPV